MKNLQKFHIRRTLYIFVPPVIALLAYGPFIIGLSGDPTSGRILNWVDFRDEKEIGYNCFEPDKPLAVVDEAKIEEQKTSSEEFRLNLEKVLSVPPILETLSLPLGYAERQICTIANTNFEKPGDVSDSYIYQIYHERQIQLSQEPFCVPLEENDSGEIILPDIVYKNVCLHYVKNSKPIYDENHGVLLLSGEIKPLHPETPLVVFGGLIALWWGIMVLARRIGKYILEGVID